ncbi:MAG: sporulation integral membrane protein YtvI [Peptococcaceae bacterium]
MSIRTLFFMGLGLLLIYELFTIGFPFLLALFFVVLLEPIVQFLIRLFKIKRPVSSLIVSTFFTFIVFLSFILIILKAAKESVGLSGFLLKTIKQMANNTDIYFDTTETIFKAIPPEFHAGLTELLKGLLEMLQRVISSLATYSLDIATTIPGILIETLIFFIAFYIISYSLPGIKESFLGLFDKSSHNKVEVLMSTLYKAVIGFIRAQVLISILIFIITALGLYLLGLRYVLATALVITLVDFLPVFGTGSIIIPMSIYTFINGNSLISIGLLSLYGFLIILRRIAEPKILGDAIGISALSALISMYIGFQLVGFIGLIMGPTVIIIYHALVKEDILKIKIKF